MSYAQSTHSAERLSLSEKAIMKDVKRDLIKFVPFMARWKGSSARTLEKSSGTRVSWDYGLTSDHMSPTVSSNQKRYDIFSSSCLDIKLRADSSKSVEKVVNKKKLLSRREEKEYNPKKLVYKSVRKLNKWMKKTKTKNIRETKHLKTILFHHINK
jgi:hypothetical protein